MSDDDSSFVQLGFCEPIESEEHFYDVGHRNTNYNRWDGGQMGGYPTWLNPYSIPSQPMECKACPMKMNFLCQLYAPIDDTGNSDDNDNKAYHRTIYIYVCPNMASPGHTPTSSVRVLRCQLKKDNPYWPAIPNNNNSNNDNYDNGKSTTPIKAPQQQQKRPSCIVCAFPSQGRCPLQKVHFCCKEHQILYKKYVYKNQKLTNNTSSSNEIIMSPTTMTLRQQQNMISLLPNNILYPLYEIVVEDENDISDDNDDEDILNRNKQQHQSDQITQIETMFPSNKKGNNNDDEYDSDEELEQDDLNEMVQGQTKGTSKKQDRIYEQFMDRIQNTNGGQNKNQILRYNRWPNDDDDISNDNKNGPLWIQTNIRPSTSSSCMEATTAANTRTSDIPKCQYCGSQRKFEFQIMPQLLHYLNKKTNKESNIMTAKDGDTVTTTTDSTITTKNSSSTTVISQQVIDAIEQTNTLIDNVPAELISPDLVDTKERAIQTIQRTLFNQGNSNNNQMDWGIIAVYTCTNSCSYAIETATRKNKKVTSTESINDHTTFENKNGFGNDDDQEENLGEYLEEFAWVQPSIDSIV